MNYNFTDRVRSILAMAREDAVKLGHDYVGTEHILLGLMREGEGVATQVLTRMGVESERIVALVRKRVNEGKGTGEVGELPYTGSAKKVLEFAMSEARSLHHSYVGTEHILLGLLRQKEGLAAGVLAEVQVTFGKARREVMKILGTSSSEESTPAQPPRKRKEEKKSKTPALDHFCRDITNLARENRLDPIIGRAVEIERIMEVLARRKKNNPVLIGEPGGWEDGNRGGPGPGNRPQRCTGCAGGAPDSGPRHGRGGGGHEVQRAVRGATEGDRSGGNQDEGRNHLHR